MRKELFRRVSRLSIFHPPRPLKRSLLITTACCRRYSLPVIRILLSPNTGFIVFSPATWHQHGSDFRDRSNTKTPPVQPTRSRTPCLLLRLARHTQPLDARQHVHRAVPTPRRPAARVCGAAGAESMRHARAEVRALRVVGFGEVAHC